MSAVAQNTPMLVITMDLDNRCLVKVVVKSVAILQRLNFAMNVTKDLAKAHEMKLGEQV